MSAEEPSLRALAHPIRLQVLSLLTGAAMSAAEVAREVGTTQANASYHLRQLQAAGLLEVTEVVSVRGGQAKRYRHDPMRGHDSTHPRPDDAVAVAAALSAELHRRTLLRLPDQGAHGYRSPLTDAELWVDPQVWADVSTRVLAAMVDLHAAAQPVRTPGTIRTSSTVSLFVMQPGSQDA